MDINTTTTTTNQPSSTSSATLSTTVTTTNSNNNRDQFLRHLNKLSHKISKPTLPPPSNAAASAAAAASSSTFKKPPIEPLPPPVHSQPPQQQQPPVYNINKSQFRDVVQKLTGSPAHATAQPPQPPPIHAPKPTSSRLQRIRPPPLAQLNTCPPHLLNSGAGNPLSPLPPLPTCHAAAESPISAYMRFLHSSGPILPPPQPQASVSDTAHFGYFPSPKSPCPLLSPTLVFSPTGNGALGFPQLPVSPTVPSPKWRDL